LVSLVFSSDILRSRCFLGRTKGSMPKPCSMMVRLTLTRSRADRAKTSLFRERQEMSFSSSREVRSSLITTVCLGVAVSRGTAFVPSLLCSCAFTFSSATGRVPSKTSRCAVRQCTFRWPRMKSLSIDCYRALRTRNFHAEVKSVNGHFKFIDGARPIIALYG
jgi:hypothetical protein